MSETREEAWIRNLAAGDGEAAWDDFLTRHRALMFATINPLVHGREARQDAFVAVCEGLRRDSYRRLRKFDPQGPAKFSTWLVTVVRHLVVDWYRSVHGRRRIEGALTAFPALERRLFHLLADRSLSFAEAYESLRANGGFTGGFGPFLRVVRSLYRTVTSRAGPLARELVGTDPGLELNGQSVVPDGDLAVDAERALAELACFPVDVRIATLLFVVDDVPAAEVARLVGWAGPKTVYNRVHRALAAIRRNLSHPSNSAPAVRAMPGDQSSGGGQVPAASEVPVEGDARA